jgi:hypothetical protein
MSPTFVMLALLVGCYAACAALVLFAENVIRPRSTEPAEAADLSQSSTLQQVDTQ